MWPVIIELKNGDESLEEAIDYNGNKGFRLLSIYERLNKGEMLNKQDVAACYGVSEKTIQRDIDDLRAYLAEAHQFECEVSVKYDRQKNGYYLVHFEREWFTNEEILAVSKILLESRAFEKSELTLLIDKLLAQAGPADRKLLDEIIKSEYTCYVPLRHGRKLFQPLWRLSQCIYSQKILTFTYTRMDGNTKEHKVKPVAIMFSEYYFYLVAFLADGAKISPAIFRVDRMSEMAESGETFSIPYRDKFSDGEFRKRVQFMYSGELRRLKFEYSGPSIEAVLDRLPTAEILHEQGGRYTLRAEVYGDGIDMWLRSQGDTVKLC